jgi:glycine/D-amino acid oxidase-like deaminating enzyme
MASTPRGKGQPVQEPNTTLAAGETQPQTEPATPQVDAAYGETWFTANGTIAPPRPPLPNDLDVDVCIIGGGLAGLTIAREVARRNWSVAVLESHRVAWNASSRNSGFVMPGFAMGMHKLIERAGSDRARELWMLSQDGVDCVRRSIKDGRMRDVMQSEGWLHVSKIDRAKEISDEAELLRGLGADIEVWPTTLVRSKVKSPYYFQAIHFPTAFNIHPYNYALAIAQSAEDAGARIFEQTAAISIDPAGVRKRVVTSHGRIRAAHIVFAGNVHLGPIMPDIAQTLIPVHTFAMVTKPLGDNLATALEYPGAVSDTAFADHRYRIVGGGRLMFAGRVATREANPRRHGRRLRADLKRRFPQLGPVEIEHAWSGTIGITVHGMPQVGEVSPGVWLASGFGAHGLNTTAMAANLIAGAIVDGDDRFRLFEPFELVWAGGRIGRFVAKRFYLAQRAYEQWASRRSRKRELWWIKNEPRLKREAEEAAERARVRAEQAAIAEAERIEREKIEAEHAEARRIEGERIAAEKAEAKRIRAEEKAAAKVEAARLKEERRAAKRAEKERIAAEKAEAKRLAAERLAAERAEAERIAAEQAEAERIEAERKAAEQAEAERVEAERVAVERIEAAEAAVERLAEATSPAAGGPEAEAAPLAAQDQAEAPAAISEEPKAEQPEEARPQPRRGFWRRG